MVLLSDLLDWGRLHYIKDKRGNRTVLLNGRPIQDAVSAYEHPERGWVEVFERDPNGRFILEFGGVRNKIMEGRVEMRFDREAK